MRYNVFDCSRLSHAGFCMFKLGSIRNRGEAELAAGRVSGAGQG